MIRVSDVLNVLFPGGLDYVQESDLDRGTRLHFIMEVHCNNIIHGYEGDMPASWLGGNEDPSRIEAVAAWMEQQGLIPLTVEQEYCDATIGYEGHPDCVGYRFQRNADVKRQDLTIDWKFAETITPGNLIQAEAYRRLVGNPVWLVQCNRKAEIKIHKCKPRPDLWAVFLSGLNVLKFQQGGK